MKTVYAVSTVPVRDTHGAIVGWLRADPLADGTKPTDMVVLRDGSAWSQAEAAQRIALDPGLLHPTRDAAVKDGLARLRKADRRLVRPFLPRPGPEAAALRSRGRQIAGVVFQWANVALGSIVIAIPIAEPIAEPTHAVEAAVATAETISDFRRGDEPP